MKDKIVLMELGDSQVDSYVYSKGKQKHEMSLKHDPNSSNWTDKAKGSEVCSIIADPDLDNTDIMVGNKRLSLDAAQITEVYALLDTFFKEKEGLEAINLRTFIEC